MHDDELTAALLDALRETAATSPIQAVQVETEDGLEMLLYGPAGDEQHADQGTLFIPSGVLPS
ncbi:hypothetical protein ABZ499_27520 [Streptomyces sp. NPDC019990]|uniref:hypothetical protein n=1 Tax=Streptomyces sp. NPDC019990 TaxID=3154693 RepID=UPI0033D1E5DA